MAIVRHRNRPFTVVAGNGALPDMAPLSNRLARLLDDPFPAFPAPLASGLLAGRSEPGVLAGVPAVDVEETEEALILTADLPGYAPDQVEIQVENQVLTLSGSREVERERSGEVQREPAGEGDREASAEAQRGPSAEAQREASGEAQREPSGEARGPARRFHLRERSRGRFTRAFTLPRGIRTEEISASFDQGVLTVHMPRSAELRPRRIEIRTGA